MVQPGGAGAARKCLTEQQPTAAPKLEEMIVQAVRNLAENAAKYSPTGGAITLGAAVANGMIAVAVRDEGPGIPIEERDPAELTSRFPARNPAFDVTPAALIAAIVTEDGVHCPPFAF